MEQNAREEAEKLDHGLDRKQHWEELALHEDLIKVLLKKKFVQPTHAQSRAIPFVLEGKDVSCRAHTGSGKTLAYLLPAMHKMIRTDERDLLSSNASSTSRSTNKRVNPRIVVLVPTKELALQVKRECQEFFRSSENEMIKKYRVGELPDQTKSAQALREAARNCPDVLVSTPARVATCLKEKLFLPRAFQSGQKSGLEMLILDECDLLLSFGHEKDIKYIFERAKEGVQAMLVSATTTSEEVGNLKQLLLSKPVEVDCDDIEELEEKKKEELEQMKELKKKKKPLITHFSVQIKNSNDKLLHLMALLRLGLCKKKILIFVKDADAAVRARLFLHKFGVLCVALHAELPANSRAHILEEFNRGVHDVLVAAADDDNDMIKNVSENVEEDEEVKKEEEEEEEGEDNQPIRKSKKDKKKEKEKKNRAAKKDSEFGVSRGVDFKKVHTVINFECPKTFEAYQHRVGRTGRAGATGVAVTLIAPADEPFRDILVEGYKNAASKGDEEEDVDGDDREEKKKEEDNFLKPFDRLPKEAIEALRYRAEDTLRAISKSAVKDARLRELRVELLNSERLASHFEENPDDLNLLRHDSSISKRDDTNKYLSHLPAYLRNASKKKRKKNAINAVETEDVDEAKWAAMQLDVDVAEFGQKKNRRRKDKRDGGREKKTRQEVGAKIKQKAGRKRSR